MKKGKIERLREIAEILLDHGLVEFIKEMGLTSFISKGRLETSLEKQLTEMSQEDLRMLLEDLGPTFIKLGQFLALRPDLVPIELAEELRKLYEDVSPFPAEDSRRIIKEELGMELDEIFDEFYNTPIASASIGQVHEAKLKDGREVVVKVQRPDIRERVQADMALIERTAKLIEDLVQESEIYQPKETVKEFKKMLNKEMDYTIEARNAQRFHEAFEDDPNVLVPKVVWEYVTKRVFVMENMGGKSMRQAIDGDLPQKNKKILAKNFARCMLKQFFIHGIFHADPSPGNIFYKDDCKIVLLDFGAVGRLSERRREQLIEIFMSMAKGDIEEVKDNLIEMGEIQGDFDEEELLVDIENIIDLYKLKPGVLFREGANEEIMMIPKKHNITLPANFLLMERALVETEGICNSLDPHFDFFDASKPVIQDVLKMKYGPKAIMGNVVSGAKDYYDLFNKLPNRVNRILDRVEKEELTITIQHEGLDELEERLDFVSNRISYTIIAAALIIGSALIVLSTQQPLFGPYIFLVSVLIGVWLLLTIVKRGKI